MDVHYVFKKYVNNVKQDILWIKRWIHVYNVQIIVQVVIMIQDHYFVMNVIMDIY
jgi:hypothetical protein